jgi:hypothetical protein
MSYVDETGIYLDTFDEVKTKLVADLQEVFGDGINTDNAARFGQLVNILSERISDQNELIQLVANSQDPTGAIGVWLEQIVKVNGIDKNEAEFSTVPVQLTANAAGTTVLEGDTFEVLSTGEKFAIDSDVTIAPSSSETTTATAINPGAVECDAALSVVGGELKIDNPRYGFYNITTLADATLGALEESSGDLRIRRELAAQQTGNSSPAALYRKLADLDGVTEVKVYQNIDGTTDSLGVPGHSVWIILVGGVESEVAQTIFENIGAGVGMYGNNSAYYNDPITGETWLTKYSVGIEVPIYITVRTKKVSGYPGDGDARIKQNIVDFFNGEFTLNGEQIPAFGLGADVVSGRLFTPANVVPGHELVEVLISTTPTPTASTTIAITPEQYAGTDVAKIVITAV